MTCDSRNIQKKTGWLIQKNKIACLDPNGFCNNSLKSLCVDLTNRNVSPYSDPVLTSTVNYDLAVSPYCHLHSSKISHLIKTPNLTQVYNRTTQ